MSVEIPQFIPSLEESGLNLDEAWGIDGDDATTVRSKVSLQNGFSTLAPSLRYVVEKTPFARGAFCSVYKAFDRRLARLVAIKVPIPEITSDFEKANSELQKEARVMANYDVPGVIRVLDWLHLKGDKDGIVSSAIVMDWCDTSRKPNVKEYLVNGNIISSEILPSLVASLASTLTALKNRGVLHGDIKPNNLFYDIDKNQLFISDFGLSTPVGANPIYGTYTYSAPERFLGQEKTETGEVFSLGMSLFQILVGEALSRDIIGEDKQIQRIALFPFITTIEQGIYTFLPQRYPKITERQKEMLVVFFHRALHDDPLLRYQTFSELSSDFSNVFQD